MKSSDWISVKDRLPKIGEYVLVCCRATDNELYPTIACRTDGRGTSVMWYGEDGFDLPEVTHWQKIVLPKKEEE